MTTANLPKSDRIAIIRDFVLRLREQVGGFSEEELTTQYNAPEWTIAQNVHHLVDSHMNSYIRFKLILTEEHPTLRGYSQDGFAALPDGSDANIGDSLVILTGLHTRWARMLNNITDWERTGYHPESDTVYTLDTLLTAYADHCNAHIQQIQDVIDKMPAK